MKYDSSWEGGQRGRAGERGRRILRGAGHLRSGSVEWAKWGKNGGPS